MPIGFSPTPLRGSLLDFDPFSGSGWNPFPESPFDIIGGQSPFSFDLWAATPYVGTIRNIGPSGPITIAKSSLGSISDEEHAEIDAAAIEAARGGLLEIAQDARYARDAGTQVAIFGESAPPPQAAWMRAQSAGFANTPENVSGVYVPEDGESTLPNLNAFLGGLTRTANTLGDVATAYYRVRAARSPPPIVMPALPPPAATIPAPPALNPAGARVPLANAKPPEVAPTHSAASVFDLSGFRNPFASGNRIIQQAGLPALPGGTRVAGLGKVAAIAAALGIGVEVVDAVLGLDEKSKKRRRRRMLTKSDVADIAVMANMLGKGSESFRTWLATNLRR